MNDPRIPERIGKFVISSILGQGAMGVVYKAMDPHIRRTVAIKTVHKRLLGAEHEEAAIAARFRNEAQAVGRLHHPGIVAIYEYGEDENCAYIAMEYVEGRNLDEVLQQTPLLPEARVREVITALLDALDCAHSQGVWHRDVKPANLIITTRGEVKLTDFGIARLENMGLTQVNSTIGTPGYMAPEQYIGEAIDHRVDLFAAGVLLYRLLTGVAPFVGSPETVMYKIMNENPRPPSTVQPGRVAVPFDAVIARAMAKSADQRYPSARAFREALDLLAPAGPAPSAGGYAPSGEETIVRPTGWPATGLKPASQASWPAPVAAAPVTAPVTAPITGAGSGTRFPAASEALKAQAIALLTRHLGPVARVVVKRAADSASNREDFIARVIDTVDAAERAALRRALEVIH